MFQDSLLAPFPPWTLEALRALARHRFLTTRQLAVVLSIPADRLDDGLVALVGEGLLQRLGHEREPSRVAFTPTRAGLALLVRAGEHLAPRALVRHRALHTLAHELVVNDLAIVLEKLHATRAVRLLDWQTARERLADVAHVLVRRKVQRVPLVADALAVVDVGSGPTGFLVEIDMGTVSIARMRAKYAGYFRWWQDGGPVRRYGLPATRVLTVASSRRRLERLRTIACEAAPPKGSGLFWFLPQEAVDPETPERLLDSVATIARAGDDAARTLLAVATPIS